MARPAFGWDAARFNRPDGDSPECVYTYCDKRVIGKLPVCYWHAMYIAAALERLSGQRPEPEPSPPAPVAESYVYYLMLAPTVVKIGTTRNLRQRVSMFRTDVQYVVAIERGDMKVERERHRQFAAERMGRRENFQLSERLKKHIDKLQPQRDELVEEALNLNLKYLF